MRTNDTIIADEQSAVEYDQRARESGWFGHEVVFGMTYAFTKPGDTLLDLGIGSGLSSFPFHRAGLYVYGLDGSAQVLKVCKSKGFAKDLKQHDLRHMPLPYPSGFFNHVISVSVLNSFADLGPLFAEVARVIQTNGIFAFTVEEQKPGQEDHYAINRVAVTEQPQEESAVMLFRHPEDYITTQLSRNGFAPLKALEFVAFKYPAEHRDVLFKAWIAAKLSTSPETGARST
jgi:predicted TPR repeat methyltransferase